MKMCMSYNLPVEISTLIGCHVFERKKEDHRAMFSGELHKSVVHAK